MHTMQNRIAQLDDYHDSLRDPFILNGKQLSTLEPFRANQPSFIHNIGADGEYE